MKKLKINILHILLILILSIEFLWSILYVIMEAVGGKLNEAADAIEAAYQKAKI